MLHRVFLASLCVAVVATSGCGGGKQASADDAAAAQLRKSAADHSLQQQQIDSVASNQAALDAATASTPPTTSPSVEPAASTTKRPADVLLSPADKQSFAALGAALPGAEGVAVSYLGLGQPVYRAGTFTTGVAWSSSKPAVAMAAIGRGTASESDLTQAITASDNAAAERLWAGLGASAATDATAQVRAAGDSTTVIQGKRLRGAAYTAFGQTAWSLVNETRFVAGMGCAANGPQVLALMRQVVPGQRWGLGTIGTKPAFKGGWGPGIQPGVAGGWLDRQLGIVTIGGKPVAVSIASTAGDHASATAALTKIAGWLKTHVDTSGAPPAPRCG